MPAKNNKTELKSIPIDRDKITPCKLCRKRESCIIRPREGRCVALEKGEPWVMPDNSIDPYQIDLQED